MGNLKSKVSDLKKKSRNKKALKGQVHQRNSQEIQQMDQDANQPASSERRDQQLDFSLTSEEADQVIFEREVNHLCSNKFFPHLVSIVLIYFNNKFLQTKFINFYLNYSLVYF